MDSPIFEFFIIIILLYIASGSDKIHGDNIDNKIYGGTDIIHSHPDDLLSDQIIGGIGLTDKYMKMNLMDPKHNLREIAKQMILLEDHMSHKRKRCVDCITKHYLMIEALLEEAITLDKNKEHLKELEDIIERIKPIIMGVIDDIKSGKMKNQSYADKIYQNASQILRIVRKQISFKYVLNN